MRERLTTTTCSPIDPLLGGMPTGFVRRLALLPSTAAAAAATARPRLLHTRLPTAVPHRSVVATRRILADEQVRRSSPLLCSSTRPLLLLQPTRTMPGPTPPYRSGSTTNFYAGSNLNRFSWLRNSSDFINGAVSSPSARFVLLNNLNPLVHKASGGDEKEQQEQQPTAGSLATLGWSEVRGAVLESIRIARGEGGTGGDLAERVFGPDVLGLEGPAETASEADAKQFARATESVVPPNLVLVFLGVDESGATGSPSVPGQLATDSPALEAAEGKGKEEGKQLEGVPYFALSVSYAPHQNDHFGAQHEGGEEAPVHALREALLGSGRYEFVDTRSLAQAAAWPAHDAAVLAQARSLVDWNERQAYCPACSRRQYSLWSGHKRSCSSVLASSKPTTAVLRPFLPAAASGSGAATAFEEDGRLWPCPATKALSNFSYPRTDSVVIMGVLNRAGDKILLGRQKSWPKKMYSCLAGFLEAGESLEEAVKREIYEEAALEIEDVVYHSSQPWPFPANLMIGCFAVCKSEGAEGEVRLDLDNELEDARFFSREEVLEVIEASAGRVMTRRDLQRYEAGQNRNVVEAKEGEGEEKAEWNTKDEGSVANVRAAGAGAGEREGERAFGIPASTAIAHVLIASWARGEAALPALPSAARM